MKAHPPPAWVAGLYYSAVQGNISCRFYLRVPNTPPGSIHKKKSQKHSLNPRFLSSLAAAHVIIMCCARGETLFPFDFVHQIYQLCLALQLCNGADQVEKTGRPLVATEFAPSRQLTHWIFCHQRQRPVINTLLPWWRLERYQDFRTVDGTCPAHRG